MGYTIRGNRIYVTGTVDGKHHRLSTGKEATPINIAWIKKNHRDVLLQLIAKDKPKSSELFADFAEKSLLSNAYYIKKSTTRSYRYMLTANILPHFAKYRLDEIKPSDIRMWQSKLLAKMTPQSSKNLRALMAKILDDAVMDGLIPSNPVNMTKAPKVRDKDDITPFTLDEVLTLIGNAKGTFKHFLTVAFFTGMRPGELISLKWEDIDFNSKKIIVRRTLSNGEYTSTKVGKERVIDMLEPVERALRELFKETGLKYSFIFITRNGTPYRQAESINATFWKPLLRATHIAYRPLKNMRHTFATTMLKNGEDILWVSKMLGHSTVQTTMKYYIKFVEEKGTKRATFLNEHFDKNRTVSAQSSKANTANA